MSERISFYQQRKILKHVSGSNEYKIHLKIQDFGYFWNNLKVIYIYIYIYIYVTLTKDYQAIHAGYHVELLPIISLKSLIWISHLFC